MIVSSVVGTLVSLAVGIFVLGILVVVHETGHFLLAKLCGVGVVEYSIGFGKKIWQKRIGGTRYSVGAIPLGGYVRMVGDDPRKVYGDAEETSADATIQPIEDDDDEETLQLLSDESK
jgi:RIP metalloprotease RseP